MDEVGLENFYSRKGCSARHTSTVAANHFNKYLVHQSSRNIAGYPYIRYKNDIPQDFKTLSAAHNLDVSVQ